jgi:glycosyltransferase involved in cell wall biosynthesis
MAELALLRRLRGRIDRTIPISRRMGEVLVESGWPVDDTIPNGVALSNERPGLNGPPKISYAGRLDREKGVAHLIEATAYLSAAIPGLQLVVAGDGPDRAVLEALAQKLGVDAVFLGQLPREQMEQALATAWVHATPSVWDEPFGNVSLEAMMRGTAVVASDVGGQSDIVSVGETGALVPPGNAKGLAEALAPYLQDRELAERHGRAARQRALSEFSNARVSDRFFEHYQALVSGEGNA